MRTNANFGGAPVAIAPQSSVQVQVQSGSGLATLLGLAVLGALAYDSETQAMRYRGSPFIPVTGSTAQNASELAPERRVHEQDCTKPIADLSANLRCR